MKRFLSGRSMMLVLLAIGIGLVAAACSGSDGASGPPGSQGAQGVQGAQGLPGIQGNQGIQGPQGIPGVQGEKGVTGGTGATGAKGAKGDTGDRGDRGIAGARGSAGSAGPTLPLTLTLSATSQIAGTLNVTAYGSGFTKGATVTLALGWPDGSTSSLGRATAGDNGTFSAVLTSATALTDGIYSVRATQSGASATAPLAVGAAK